MSQLKLRIPWGFWGCPTLKVIKIRKVTMISETPKRTAENRGKKIQNLNIFRLQNEFLWSRFSSTEKVEKCR